MAPSLYLTRVNASPGQPAFLSIAAQNTQVMSLPGANIITANGNAGPIDWIVDAGVQRTDGETTFANGAPTLYAYNALTLQPLWSSPYEQLDMGGKYNTIADARGNPFVGTDRIQAFGLTGDTIVDDLVAGTGTNQFRYLGAGWSHTSPGTSTPTMGTFDGTVSTDNVPGDSATLTFSGSKIQVYADEKSGYGSVAISVDGGNAQTVLLTNTTNSPNGQGQGDVLVYTLAGLGSGAHTLTYQNTSASTIALDRVEITPLSTSSALGVSLTDGNVTPVPGGVLPYTINDNNAGSLSGGTGVNASGVVLTETVPANTTADLASSTPGGTLASGSGGAGSTYTFAVGALVAGDTGSVVFSVNVNASIPAGTSTLTDTVTIRDAAADTSSGSRVTPLGTPVATRLAFAQPPGNGETGQALAPAVAVAVQDQFGNTFTSDSPSTVTLTLNGGTFAGGGNTATSTVSNGVATFGGLVLNASGTYTLAASDGTLTGANSGRFAVTGQTVSTVDDSVQGTGTNQFHYVGTWAHVTGTNIPNSYHGTVSYTDTANDSVTITFVGTRIKLYIAERNNRGIGAVSVDGGPETTVDEYAAQDTGDVLAFTSATLASGTHTLKLRNTGTRNAASTGTRVDVDRVDLLS